MALNVSLSFPSSADASAAIAQGLLVQRYELCEAMSELFELTLEVLSTDPALAESAFVGQRVVVDFGDEPFLKQLQGIVRAMVQHTAVPLGSSRYTWVVVPPLWLTTRRRDHRIFQHLSAPEIVEAVLVDPSYGGRIPLPASRLTGTFEAREYCVQYGETDWDFLSRILADEGIAGFFDHEQGSIYTLVDDTTVAAPRLGATIPFSDPSNQSPIVLADPSAAHVQTVVIASKVETSAVTLRDYDFEKPEFVLEAKRAIAPAAAFPNEADLESYGFEVGAFTRQAPGDQRAATMLESARSGHRHLSCTASFVLSPGTVMRLVDHPRAELDADFLVVRASAVSEFGKAHVRSLELMEHTERFRPARRARARIMGTQTAFVVGAEGEEIDVDRFGRVEVEFRWDRRDQHTGGTSRRVRVAQGWAGAGFGFVMLPRVNEEVIVAYLEGDPDQPIIVGRVHNAFVTSPLSLPAQKTVSVWRSRSSPGGGGYNEILMDDAAGAERLWVHAERDYRSETGRNADTKVGVNQTLKVGGSQTVSVGGGKRENIGGDVEIHVGGSADADIGGASALTAQSLTIGLGGDLRSSAKNNLISAAELHEVTAGTVQMVGENEIWQYCGAAMLLLDKGTITLRVSGSSIAVEESGITLQAGGSAIHVQDSGIKISSSGPVEVNGALIKLNC